MFVKSHIDIDKDTDDRVLLQLLKKGDKASFTIIYEKYSKMVYALALRYTKGVEMSEDTVQYVFTKLWEMHSCLEVSVSLKNFLYTMTKNYVLNLIRNKNTELEKNYILAQENTESFEPDIIRQLEKKEKMDAFFQAIEELPDQKKKICRYKLEGNLSNQEIADKMDISINTLKTHYSQSIILLKKYLRNFMILSFLSSFCYRYVSYII